MQDEAETAQGEGCEEDDGGLSVSTSEGHEGAPANLRGVRGGDDDMERGEGPQDPPSGAARPSVSNENNILLDPEVLTDHVTQVRLKVNPFRGVFRNPKTFRIAPVLKIVESFTIS